MGDKIYKIKIDPYDQVLALTQHMINEGISNLYTRLQTGEVVDDATKPEPASCYVDEHNCAEDIVFGPPAVIVKADYSNVRSVQFRMSLLSGRFQLRKFMGMNPKTKRPMDEKLILDINDWHITVPVDVGFVEVDTSSPRGKAVAERSAAKDKPDHSIYELLLDLQSMALDNAVWELGRWSDADWTTGQDGKRVRPEGFKLDEPRSFVDLQKTYQTIMEVCVKEMASELMKANLASMGFAVMAKDANRRATFEVNNARYMTYPWTDPISHNTPTPGLDGDARLNYLLYLETVDDHQPPKDSSPDAILSTRMGNWTDGRKPGIDSPSSFGTFVLSSANFMEAYFIPNLSAINRIMSMDIYEVKAKAYPYFASWGWEVECSYNVGAGDSDDDNTTYRLKKQEIKINNDWQQEAKDFLEYYTRSPGSGCQVWNYQDIEWGSTNKNAYSHEGSVEVWMSGDTITFTRLYTTPNSNTIVYEGGQWTKFEYKVDPSWIESNEYGKVVAQTKWAINFQMQEVMDGGMQFGITQVRPTTTFSGDFSNLPNIKAGLEKRYKIAGDNFEFYTNSIRNCLAGQEKFTLPASGVYFFKNPVMNAHGDLVCGLEYNGNPKLGGQINMTTDRKRDDVAQGTITNQLDAAEIKKGGTF
ncbi:hypothetical protein KCU73_g4085, partial [Aureobasidium melanogenum]